MHLALFNRLVGLNKNFMKNTGSKIIKVGEMWRSERQRHDCDEGKKEENWELMNNLREKLSQRMGVKSGYTVIPEDRTYLLKYLPKTQEELPKRTMQDSFVAGIIPLSTDKKLQDKYVTFIGSVRIGRLLEDMDMFAVLVAHTHILVPTLPKDIPYPYTLVTALVDRIDLTDYVPKPKNDIKISGHVSWVGKSSIEVVVWLEQLVESTWQRITRALFVLAARDSINKKPAIVNALEATDDEQKEILSGGESRKKKRTTLTKLHVSRTIPDAEEQKIIHDIYMKTTDNKDLSMRKRHLPDGCVWMHDWTLSSVVFSHPENRNTQYTVFGGFIMLNALELTFVLAFMYSKHRPFLKTISDITFLKPIKVSSIMQMHAHVVYTQAYSMQIAVYTEIFNPLTGKTETTNTFHFKYEVPEQVPQCLPLTYQEAMMYVDGRRHFLENETKIRGKAKK